jgi:hypothetical protein
MNRAASFIRLVLILATMAHARVLAGAEEKSEQSTGVPRLLVVWHDAHHLYPGSHTGVAREVAALFAPLEVEMHWQRAKQFDPPLDRRTILLRIVLLPSDPAGPGWELGGDVMGAVLPANGRARSIYVFYPTLVRGLKLEPRAGRYPDFHERKLLEKALGCVVAHEMVHAVAPGVSHQKRGLMQPGVTRSFLARHDAVVSGPLRQAFVAGVENILSSTSSSVVARSVNGGSPQVVRHAAEPAPGPEGH